MKFWSKILFPLLTMCFLVTPASAQFWPMPGKGTGVPCTACVEPAKGRLTYPFNDPLVRHVGRYVDSAGVGNVQNAGMRTVRAREIRTIPGRNRMLVALGEAVGVYDTNTFFTSKLGTPMTNVDKAFVINSTRWDRYTFPFEKVLPPDGYFYAEAQNSEWEVLLQDSQIQLGDFDMDDRGYLYVATVSFGWGIAKDTPHSGARHLDYVTQVKDGPVKPNALFALRVGSKYYVVISENQRSESKLAVHDATTLVEGAVPRVVASRIGTEAGIVAWDRHDETQRLAVITSDSHLHIYDYADFVAAGSVAPVASYSPSTGRSFSDVSFDEDGRLWATEKTASPANSQLWRLTPSGNGYTQAKFDVYGTSIVPTVVHAAGGYVAVGGFTPDGNDIVLMKVDGGTPQRLELDNFFRKYYHKAPEGYVAVNFRSPSYYQMADIELVERGNKVYLMFGAGAMGDVYELEAGDSISVSMVGNTFGTPNPSSASTEPGPYYGDILKFKATTTSSTNFPSIDWDFDNPDSGNANGANSGLNQVVEHQFTGLQNATAVAAAKAVKAEVSNNSSISDTLSVSLKVPKARIRIPGRTEVMTQETKADFQVVVGDELIDASDGVVEGHFAGWTIDNAETRKLPTEKMDVGDLGSHRLAFTAYYGKYDAEAFSDTKAFKSVINNIDYEVLPFLAKIRPPVTSGSNYVFDADVRVTQVPGVLTAGQWTVTWSVEGSASIAASELVDIGEVPPFPVEKTPGLNGKFVTLQISVDPTSVPDDAFATFETSLKLEVPDIQINKTSGCINAGEPCKLTAVPAGSGSSANWQLKWTVKRGTTTVVNNATTNPITFTPEPGLHTVTVVETAYDVTKETTFTVLPPACGPLPPVGDVDIGWSCGNNCEKNSEIDFEASVFPNSIQPCHQFVWDFGDNTAAGTGQGTTHTYTKDGSFKVKVTIKTATSTSNTVKEETITIGGDEPPPPPPCTFPADIDFIYTGNQGCSSITGVACKTTELVTFSGRRGTSGLASCDNTAWEIDGVPYTAKSPKHTFTTTGNKTVKLTVTNTVGTANPVTKTLNITQGSTGTCTGGTASAEQLGISFAGLTSSCGNVSGICQLNESIEFTAELFGYTPKTCDQFEWTFGDNTPVVLGRQVTHTYTGARNSARVKLRIYNTSNTTGAFTEVDVPFTTVNEEPAPTLAFNGFPTGGAKGTPVTFRVDSNLNATGWSWNFDDGSPVDNSQNGVIGTSTSITHTFTKTGTFNVRVTARNAASPASGRTNFAQGAIVITDTPEYKYLIPVVTHVGGLGGSEWRTDVQIYNQDPNVSPTKPLVMTATLGNVARTLEIFDATYIYEDFMRTITNVDGTGPVIITARTQYPPQIWTRTYTQTETGTFGQFIPAIRLDQAGGGAAAGSGKYFLAGLRSNARYRTNVGLVNPTTSTLPITVAVYDDVRERVAQFTKTVGSLQWYQFNIKDDAPGLKADRPFSIELSVPDGQWLIAYASFLDNGSNDPVYMQAVRESVLNSPDYRNSIVPGVGHTGAWRSDVTVFNPNTFKVNVDLAYHDTTGAKKGEALAIPISAGQFLQYDDILKQGIFSNVEDGLGMLRVTLANADNSTISPMTFARTYHDNGSGKTYGQGIRGFAAAQANVRPGRPALIAGVRNDPKYRTNLGLSNVSSTEATVTVKYLHPATGASMRETQTVLKPFESLVGPISFDGHERASIRLEVTGGNVWGFCSIIDRGTQDTYYADALPHN